MATHRAKPRNSRAAGRGRPSSKEERRRAAELKLNEALRREDQAARGDSRRAAGQGGPGHQGRPGRQRSNKAPHEPRRPPDTDGHPPRRRTGRRIAVAGVCVALVAGLGFAVSELAGQVGGTRTVEAAPVLSEEARTALTSVPPATFDAVGAGSAKAVIGRVRAPALTADGKPRLLFVSAESCPLCAAQRWPVVVALSRFGTWQGLTATSSPSDAIYPNTPTLTFHGATYTSRYLSFTGVETEGRVREGGVYPPLGTLTAADAATLAEVNAAPYVPAQSVGILPFFNLAGRYVGVGAQFGPQLLEGNTHAEIAAALADPGSYLARAITGSANVITAAVCAALAAKAPEDICDSAGVKSARALLAVRPG